MNGGIPSADDVAIAVVVAAREYGESPLAVFSPEPNLNFRRAAFCALEMCFPNFSKRRLQVMIGAPPGFLSSYERGVPKAARQRRIRVQHLAAEAVFRQREERMSLGDVAEAQRRRPLGENVTAKAMGDPPFERSALSQQRKPPRPARDDL